MPGGRLFPFAEEYAMIWLLPEGRKFTVEQNEQNIVFFHPRLQEALAELKSQARQELKGLVEAYAPELMG